MASPTKPGQGSVGRLIPTDENGHVSVPNQTGTKRKRVTEPKLYSVRSGHTPGIYHSWAECIEQVRGFKGAIFKSFTTLTDAERFLRGEDVCGSRNAKPVYKFYAVRAGRVPGIYTDWPSAQQQITGWTKPQHKCFTTRAEAQRFLEAGDAKAQPQTGDDSETAVDTGFHAETQDLQKKQKRGAGATVRSRSSLGQVKDSDQISYEPGITLPPGAEDGFDPNILLDEMPGNFLVKTRSQKAATKLQASGPVAGSILTVYTDGSTLNNGQEGAVGGVGVYFGPGDERNYHEPLPGSKQTNQRAELSAVLRAIEVSPKNQNLKVVSDSQYAVNCATVWYKAWQERGWKGSNGKPVENRDIVETVRAKIVERETLGYKTKIEWIRGHTGNPYNAEADRLAIAGAHEAKSTQDLRGV